jgi:hypothetical protein
MRLDPRERLSPPFLVSEYWFPQYSLAGPTLNGAESGFLLPKATSGVDGFFISRPRYQLSTKRRRV